MAYLIHEDRTRQIDEEWQALLRRPDAPPLPPEEPTVGLGTRLNAAVRAVSTERRVRIGGLGRAGAARRFRRRRRDGAGAGRRGRHAGEQREGGEAGTDHGSRLGEVAAAAR